MGLKTGYSNQDEKMGNLKQAIEKLCLILILFIMTSCQSPEVDQVTKNIKTY